MKTKVITPAQMTPAEMQALLTQIAGALAAMQTTQQAPKQAPKAEKQASKQAPTQAPQAPTQAPQAPKAVRKAAKQAVNKLDCSLIEYSDKSLAVIGDTKPIKDTLKELGGRFNRFLKPGGPDADPVPGWIFSTTKKAELEKIFS